MEDLSLHILDIVENSLRAQAKLVKIDIYENMKEDVLKIRIKDDGTGMSKDELKRAKDPFFTTKDRKRFGLGISLLAQSAKEAHGSMQIRSTPGKGTSINADFKLSDIDRKPLGNLTRTLIALISSNPDKDFQFTHKRKENTLIIDTRKMKEKLKEVSIDHPEVIKFIKTNMNDFYKVSP